MVALLWHLSARLAINLLALQTALAYSVLIVQVCSSNSLIVKLFSLKSSLCGWVFRGKLSQKSRKLRRGSSSPRNVALYSDLCFNLHNARCFFLHHFFLPYTDSSIHFKLFVSFFWHAYCTHWDYIACMVFPKVAGVRRAAGWWGHSKKVIYFRFVRKRESCQANKRVC